MGGTQTDSSGTSREFIRCPSRRPPFVSEVIPGTGGFVKYALLIYKAGSSRDLLSSEAMKQAGDAMEAKIRALPNVSGVVRLKGIEAATTVRIDEGRALL